MTVLIPQDPVAHVVAWILDLRDRPVAPIAELAGFTVSGDSLEPGVTPTRHIRVSLIASDDYQRIGDRHSVRLQLWREGTNVERNQVAALLLGLARAKLMARKENGPIPMPDPANPAVTLSQMELSVLLIGATQ